MRKTLALDHRNSNSKEERNQRGEARREGLEVTGQGIRGLGPLIDIEVKYLVPTLTIDPALAKHCTKLVY